MFPTPSKGSCFQGGNKEGAFDIALCIFGRPLLKSEILFFVGRVSDKMELANNLVNFYSIILAEVEGKKFLGLNDGIF